MVPPKVAALLNVTKSPAVAPCDASVTVSVVEPFVAANVGVPVFVVRKGVISWYLPPYSI